MRIIIADDHPIFRQGLQALFSNQPAYTIVAEAGNGIQLLAMLADTPVDVVLLDLEMPGLNGLQALEKIRLTYPELRVLVLSSHSEPRIIADVAQSGAVGYLHKMSLWNEIAKALEVVQLGGKYFQPFPDEDDGVSFVSNDDMPRPISPSAFVLKQRLTPTERVVTRLIAKGLSSKEISPMLNITPNTVDTHRRNIFQKLEISSVAALVAFAFRNGLAE